MNISPHHLPRFFKAINTELDSNADEIIGLDQAIGDGDHLTNLQRGLKAVQKIEVELSEMNWSDALMKIGMTLMSTMGGASGSLFGSFFLAMSKAAKGKTMDAQHLAAMFDAGVSSVKQRGKADIGEKTMLDSLIPACESLKQDVATNQDLAVTVANLKQAAEKGMLSTEAMVATKGRASFLGERARGHLDAGARTSQLIISVIADEVIHIQNEN
ncbi:Phosphoenolpyruvate-dihydroxyacetone phosphotransferase, ADP-binding subunit DhaL [Methylophaga thiooxydans]|uniref:Phosphoenolpyruvate-dihydroxyacetone phosphotransferase, ADP-binding subunit DhaL n=1 Tax=Methylophaga thiooxydans TaxID=392484 RepID=A0A0A0BD66_9GAMM|nr:dihydroxyacetone kinase subunit DhaL [Methylophaga thiooxydans]KGM05896.1 Phosphoenolpyruvate-dihydroxyacetone phosphotransferase, ADP-binding subunit DhaL [Methylophaga thiooxydans]